jgi:hypothetical protein
MTPRPDNTDSAKYDNIAFHQRVLDCHPGTVFYYSLPGRDIVNARAILRLCVICGLRHATYGFEVCLTRVIEARDAASKQFLCRDIWNAERVEEFKREEEGPPEDGPALTDITEANLERLEKPGSNEGSEGSVDNGRQVRITKADDMLRERASELRAEEKEVEDLEKDFFTRRQELELLAGQVRIRRLGLQKEKRRLVEAHQIYEKRMKEFGEDETQEWMLAVIVSEVEDLCMTEF